MVLGLELRGNEGVLTVVGRRGEVLASVREALEVPVSRWWEIHPESFFRTCVGLLETVLREGVVSAGEVAAIGLSADPALVLLDAEYDVVPPRDLPWRSILGDGELPVHSCLTRLAEEDPRAVRRLGSVLSVLDFVRFRMTGALATHESFAWQTGLVEGPGERDRWSRDKVADLGLRPDALPPIFPGAWKVGSLNEELVEKTGIQRGTWVVAGCDALTADLFVAVEPVPGTRVVELAPSGTRVWRVCDPPQCFDPDYRPLPLTVPRAHSAVGDVWYRPSDEVIVDPRGALWTAPGEAQWTLDSRVPAKADDWQGAPVGDVWFTWDFGGPSAGSAILAGMGLGWWRDLRRLWRKGRAPIHYDDWRHTLDEADGDADAASEPALDADGSPASELPPAGQPAAD